MNKIALASDHAGFCMKEKVKEYLHKRGIETVDFGTHSTESCDYPDYAHPAAMAVENGECDGCIAMCGSGNGIQMTMNKHQGIRAALCWMPELASLARQHNNSNTLVMPARFIADELAMEIVNAWLEARFEGGRHERRVEKIAVK